MRLRPRQRQLSLRPRPIPPSGAVRTYRYRSRRWRVRVRTPTSRQSMTRCRKARIGWNRFARKSAGLSSANSISSTSAGRSARQRPRAARRRARPGQDARVENPGRRHPAAHFHRMQFTPDLLPADIVGTHDLQPAGRQLPHETRPDLRQLDPGRRNQPRAGQGAKRAARSDAGTAGHAGRGNIPAARAVPGAGHAESRSNRKARIRCPKRRSTASCSRSWWIIPIAPRNAPFWIDGAPANRTPVVQRRRSRRSKSLEARASGEPHLHRRQDEGLHRGRRARDARTRALQDSI